MKRQFLWFAALWLAGVLALLALDLVLRGLSPAR